MNAFPQISAVFSRIHLLVYLAAATCAAPASGESVSLWIERAPGPNGPWMRLDLGNIPVDANGNPRVPMEYPEEFFRTRIALSSAGEPGDPTPIDVVPPTVVSQAKDLLDRHIKAAATGIDADPEGWPVTAKLDPQVMPMRAMLSDGSIRPAYFAFKVIDPGPDKPRQGLLRNYPEEAPCKDAGYILVSSTDEDFPIAEFATEGPTPFERLAALAKTARIHVVRYGPTFWVAEDEAGNLLASQGARPFRHDPNVLSAGDQEWSGDDATGIYIRPPRHGTPNIVAYSSYAEFKSDFASNPVYRQWRETKRERAKLEWGFARGESPEGVTISVGQTVRVFQTMPSTPAPQISFLDESEKPIAQITPSTQGGLNVKGVAPGDGLLRARSGTREYTILIHVSSPSRPDAVGDVIEDTKYYAGTWGDQPKYHQLSKPEWCPLVGCGPVAWATLLAWFERVRGVQFAVTEGGTPPANTTAAGNGARMIDTYNSLHELCDVLCSTSDEGAVYPPDMTEGLDDYTQINKNAGLLHRSWTIHSVTGTWPEEGALRSAIAIKDGYPAVTGLGALWHYVVAYGYQREKIQGPNGTVFFTRRLKCNMGWAGAGPVWYNILDTFYAADVKLSDGPNAP